MTTEQKFTNVFSNAAFLFRAVTISAPGNGIIFATDPQIANVQGVFPMPLPTQGDAVNQISGNKFIYQFADVRFTCQPSVDATAPWVQSMVRLVVATERQSTSAINTNLWVDQPGGIGSNFQVPINTRFWKINLDKIFPIISGFVPATVAGAQGAYYSGTKSSMKSFRFIIPFKQLADITTANWAPERRTYIIIMTHQDLVYSIENANYRMYFKDP